MNYPYFWTQLEVVDRVQASLEKLIQRAQDSVMEVENPDVSRHRRAVQFGSEM